MLEASSSHFRIHSLIMAKAFYCDNGRERGEGGGGVSVPKNLISMCMTELGQYSINETEGIDVFKHYCLIMPNAI